MLKGRSLMNIYQLAEEGLSYRETARLTGYSRNMDPHRIGDPQAFELFECRI